MQRPRELFLSYAREDRPTVGRLVRALELLRCEVWLDETLSGGQAWWDSILKRIKGCDAVIAAVSPSMLRSSACASELSYAAQLRKPLLPVAIYSLAPELLPPVLAAIQVVDFASDDQQSAFTLARAINDIRQAPPLPSPLPDPPPPPISYLTNLSDQLRAPRLSLDEQLSIVGRLEQVVNRPKDAPTVAHLVEIFLERHDLYHPCGKRLEKLLGAVMIGENAPGDHAHLSARLVTKPHGIMSDKRTFEVQWRTIKWTVLFNKGGNKVFIDGARIKSTSEGEGLSIVRVYFNLPVDGRSKFPCELQWNGMFWVTGVSLTVAGEQVYGEGSLAF